MLGRQIQIYFDEDDARQFLELLRSKLDLVLLQEESASPRPVSIDNAGSIRLRGFLCLRLDVDDLPQRYSPGRDIWMLDTRHSPLIEWWLPPEKRGRLSPGRLFYEPRTGPEFKDDKADQFLAFAAQVWRLARRWAVRVPRGNSDVNVGPSVADRVRQGSLELSPF